MAGRVKGTRDFIGLEAVVRQEMLQKIKTSYSLFGFEPIETPAFEYLQLFVDKSGPEIENQLYSFSDKKGEKLALRPEHTVSKMRVITSDKSLIKPIKTYSIGPVWRYEDVAKGRLREFIQADIDIYGGKSVSYDAEVIACMDYTLKKLGISGYKIHLNNRKVLQDMLDSLGIPFDVGLQVMREIDKLDKIGMDEVAKNLVKLVGNDKSNKIKSYLLGELKVKSEVGDEELNGLISYLKKYGIENYEVDRKLVRGLAYYDGNIFEFIADTGPYKGTIAAGGRYDILSRQFDSSISATGAALGFERIFEIVKENTKADFSDRLCVISIDSDDEAIRTATAIRYKDVFADLLLSDVSLSKALAYCDSKKIRYAVLIGKKDLERGEVTLRDLKEKKERRMKLSDLESLNWL
ncbi:MAG: histidine--tRNA ligase [Candidatus Parvarchaeota archaeon]|nr:histidine--tRNA ligase [Candidatus Parvarchaeota archaeon]MCW1301918.1 histidine--tRNA ligase [Candidatus Parvarchaeota archaeon]